MGLQGLRPPFPAEQGPPHTLTLTHTHTLSLLNTCINTHTHLQELWDSKGFARRFQQQVVGNLASIVDEIVDDMSELVAQRARTQVCRCV